MTQTSKGLSTSLIADPTLVAEASVLPDHHFIPITDNVEYEQNRRSQGFFSVFQRSALLPIVFVLHTTINILAERVQYSPSTQRQTTLTLLTALYLIVPLSIAFCFQPGVLMRCVSKQVVRARLGFEQRCYQNEFDSQLSCKISKSNTTASALSSLVIGARSNHTELKEQSSLAEEWHVRSKTA